MFQKLRLLIVFMCFVVLALAGCSDSSSSSHPDVDPTIKGYPNGGLLSQAPDLSESGVVILDARSADAYNAGHIPGALSMPWQGFVDSSTNLKPVSELETLLGAAGIKRDTWMIIYDDTTASWGAAGRLFWMFEYLGCPNVRILDGGWDKWVADGNTPETTVRTRKAAKFAAIVKDSVVAGKEHIKDRMNDADFALVDTRTDAEFIGWQLYNEKRGGHITGAVQIPYEWAFQTDKSILEYADMKELFESRGITPDKEIVPYCTSGIRSAYAYFICRLMGYEKVANYDASIRDWAAADAAAYPMEKMENYQALVHPAWVDALINGKNPPTYSGNRYVIIEAMSNRGGDNTGDYDAGHIPHAIHLNIYALEGGYPAYPYSSPSDGNLLPDAELQTFIENMGITTDTTVVIYGSSLTPAGRTAWALMYAGVKDVRILNGGYDAWVAAGYDVETTPNTPSPIPFGAVVPVHPEYLATTDDVAELELGPTTVLADIRRWAEFTGAPGSNTYLHFDDEGRIPGAVWGHNNDAYADADQTLRTEMEQMWEDCGITSNKKAVFYCGTGWRSSLAFYFAYLLGFPDIANYDSGFFGWSWDENNPIETGHTDKLVNAKWLKEMVDKNNDGKPYVIVETGWGEAGDYYNNGHVPGAIWVNTDEIEYDCFNARNDWPVDEGEPACMDRSTTEAVDAAKGLGPDDALPRNWWNIYPDQYLLPAIAYMGIDKNTTVVVYAKGASAAARVFWTLMYAGVEDVRFLDGGKKGWTDAGYELETTVNVRTPVDVFDPDDPGRTTAIHPEYRVNIPFVRNVVNGVETDALMVDIRAWDEYTGATAPYSYIPTSGRVAGAVWGMDSDAYVNDDGTLKSPDEIYPYWNSKGLTADKHLSFYCGTAWRSSLAWFYAYMFGYPEISNFDSSWFEWSMGEGSAYSGANPVLNPILDEYPDLPNAE
ncbi:MAG: rhodanese-like domain-containing protein [Desulfosalsimonadaceae bacterium]